MLMMLEQITESSGNSFQKSGAFSNTKWGNQLHVNASMKVHWGGVHVPFGHAEYATPAHRAKIR